MNPATKEAWAAEIKRRLDDIDSGRTQLLDDDEFDRLAWGDLDTDADTH